MRLLELLRRDEEKSIEAAWLRYRQLLEIETPDDDTLAEIKAVMHTLGKTASDAEADAETLKTLRRLEGIVRDGSGLDAKLTQAAKAATDHLAETDRLIRERADRLYELDQANESLGRRSGAADQQAHAIRLLIQRNPKLLAGIVPISRT